MSKFDLKKAVENTKFVLKKQNVGPSIRAAVVMDIDVSGSTKNLFSSGQMEKAFLQILPFGLLFDDNQEIDVYTCTDGDNIYHIEENAKESNHEGYITKQIVKNARVPLWGGTDYAPVIKQNLEDFGFYKEKSKFLGFGKTRSLGQKSSSGYPVVVYFLTDGENSDKTKTMQILQECEDAKTEIYFLFIGIGNQSFDFLKLIGNKFKNTGFLNVKDLSKIENDEETAEMLFPSELAEWLKDASK